MTFSVVACDETDIGVATASHWVAVGSLVPWARPGVGAVATQAFTDPSYGPAGLARMWDGFTATAALDSLAALDPLRDLRQVVLLDHLGRAAARTGPGCLPERAAVVDDGVAAAGNMLASAEVPGAMLDAMRRSTGPLAARMVDALRAGQRAGGDARGRQAAALRVVHRQDDTRQGHGVVVDLRVDDHDDPVSELSRLLDIQGRSTRLAAAAFPSETAALTTADPIRLRSAIARLTVLLRETGNRDPESALWLAVCHLRDGQPDTAKAVLTHHPHLWQVARRWARDLRPGPAP